MWLAILAAVPAIATAVAEGFRFFSSAAGQKLILQALENQAKTDEFFKRAGGAIEDFFGRLVERAKAGQLETPPEQ